MKKIAEFIENYWKKNFLKSNQHSTNHAIFFKKKGDERRIDVRRNDVFQGYRIFFSHKIPLHAQTQQTDENVSFYSSTPQCCVIIEKWNKAELLSLCLLMLYKSDDVIRSLEKINFLLEAVNRRLANDKDGKVFSSNMTQSIIIMEFHRWHLQYQQMIRNCVAIQNGQPHTTRIARVCTNVKKKKEEEKILVS